MKINVTYLICRETGILLSITYTGCVQPSRAMCISRRTHAMQIRELFVLGNVTQNVTFVLLKQSESVFNRGLSSLCRNTNTLMMWQEEKPSMWLENWIGTCIKQGNKDIHILLKPSNCAMRSWVFKAATLIRLIIFMRIHTCSPLLQISRIIAQCSIHIYSLLPSGNELQHFFFACCFLCAITFLTFQVHLLDPPVQSNAIQYSCCAVKSATLTPKTTGCCVKRK